MTRSPALLLAVLASALAARAGADELPIPPVGWVVDQAGLLSVEEEKALEGRLREIENSDSTQIAILTIRSLESKETIEGYALRVASAWGLGQAGKDNGVLIVLAVEDRAARIEVGRGLEGRLTDVLAMRLLEDAKPRFREGDWYGGLDRVANGVVQVVRGEYKAEPESRTSWPVSSGRKRSGASCVVIALVIGLVLLCWFFGSFSPRRRGTSWYSPSTHRSGWSSSSSSWRSSSSSSRSSSSSSFRSGGGGRFSGGGATSRW